jgi:hypothetical protein
MQPQVRQRYWQCVGAVARRQLCVHHHVGLLGSRQYGRSSPIRYVPCTCIAYPFPHRPGAGLCRWPDPPIYFLNRPPGVHADFRYRGSMAVFRPLKRRCQREFRLDSG